MTKLNIVKYISIILCLFFCNHNNLFAQGSGRNKITQININQEKFVGTRLEAADAMFRQIYAQKVGEKIDKAKPFILIANDNFYLYNKDTVTPKKLTPVIYNILKSVDHIPLAVFVLLDDKTDTKLDESSIASLKELKQFSQEFSDMFKFSYISDETVTNQLSILKSTTEFCDLIITNKTIGKNDLYKFANTIASPLMKNADIATDSLLAHLDAYMQELNFDQKSKENLHVIILTAHMAREKMCIFQYFQKYFNENSEGQHIILAEDSNSNEMAVKLLGKHILDTDIAKAFFNDPSRMHKDLLYEAAQKYLNKANEK